MIKLVATDIDGTFIRDNYTFDEVRFKKIFERMTTTGCNFVVASGNQYYQLRGIFKDYGDKISYVSDNGAYVEAHGELIFAADIPKEIIASTVDFCRQYPEIKSFLCGVECAYCERGNVSEELFNLMKKYLPKMIWVDDLKTVDDQFLKFALLVPDEKTFEYYKILRENLQLEPTTSGHGSIDLIISGCHKASGLKRLAERWKISAAECVAFGDAGNDIEMLNYCGKSYAMANAAQNVKDAAKYVCPSNEEDGVLATLDKLFP